MKKRDPINVRADSPEEERRIRGLIKSVNTVVSARLGGERFAAAVRRGEGWAALDVSDDTVFGCMVLAASVSEATGSVVGVFARDGDAVDGPFHVFGGPADVMEAWLADMGEPHAGLAEGVKNSVLLNAHEIAGKAALMAMPPGATEH
jgi:hypothetical protein